MKLVGTIQKVYPAQSGTSKNGNAWQKQDFTLSYNENSQYPNSITLTVFNQEKYIGKLRAGIKVEANFDCNSREWTDKNGAVHPQNDLTVWRDGIHSIKNGGTQAAPAAAPQNNNPQPAAAPQAAAPALQEEELPF